ncbi:MAG: hypothetical protein J6W96_02490 [Alphaproteobacteria bacterium]|nr:hypothetical protein [Alphaproteobacteria bacterium]
MLKNILKVYNEDLINGAINASSVASKSVVAAGKTEGALCVNVFAKGAVTTAAAVTITVQDSASETGTFANLMTLTVAADKSYADGELITTAILPQETKAFVKASATSSSSNSGSIRVTLGYLAR